MIVFNLIRQYSQKVSQIKFPTDKDHPFFISYLSENSTFVEDLPKLKLRWIDLHDVFIPYTKIPFTKYKPQEDRKGFRDLKWFPHSTNEKVPSGKSIVFDYSKFIKEIEKKFNPKTWRMRAGNLLKNMVVKSFSTVPDNYKKVLLYSIDTSKPHRDFMDRKIFPILLQIRDGILPYDHLLLCVINGNSCYYRLIIKDRQVNIGRARALLRNIAFEDSDSDSDTEEVKQVADIISKKVEIHIKPENKEKVHSIVKLYLSRQPEEIEKVLSSEDLSDYQAVQITTSALLTSLQGSSRRAKVISKNIPNEKKVSALKTIDKNLIDEILKPQKAISTSSEIIVQVINPSKAVDEKTPTHIFDKRQIDFKTNLKKDVENIFNVLKVKDMPLFVDKIEILDKPSKSTEIAKSDESTIEANLKDSEGKIHKVKIDIPKINLDGTFTVNGRKKCLVNQIILIPITFPKLYESRFESFYATFRINSVRTKRESYLISYMGSYWIPLFLILSYAFGFDEVCKKYGITYSITQIKPKKTVLFHSRLDKDNYIIFGNIDTTLKEELCQSFVHANIYKLGIKKEFNSEGYFTEVITEYTGRINSTYRIKEQVDNIVDPVSKQILINKQLPFKLEEIMYYMSSKVINGFKQDRNDLEQQRIRNSEVLVHLILKQILASYTTYKEQILSGNKKAKFELSQSEVLNTFINNSQIVVDMEYANPVEEMSTMTRVSPVGKNVGGIPDKRSLQNDARNVHDSYFGNIDPLDTPEAENVGIVQHLTVDAFITSSRGLFSKKEKNNNIKSGMLSTSVSLIPFVENNDGARVMLGANQGRQTIPLKNPEPPLVQSGYESLLTNVLSENFIKRAPCDGKIIKITSDYLIMTCNDGKSKIEILLTPSHLRSGSGKNTLSVFKPVVVDNQSVKKGQILAEGSFISQGSISLGRTLLTAIMPYKGYNFEDGIVISESLANSDKLTSLHGIQIDITISEKDKLIFINKLGKETIKGEPLLRKVAGELGEIIGFEDEEAGQEMAAGQLIKKSPGGKIVDIEVFSNVFDSKFPQLKELSIRTDKRYKRDSNEKYTEKGIPIDGILVRFKIEQEMTIGIGDKLTNRHGAKGIISYIEKDENMPITPWGEKVDIIVNPIGIIGRMNVGQLYELYTGLICRSLAYKISLLNDKNKVIPILDKVMTMLDTSKNKEMAKRFMLNFRSLSDRQFKLFIDQIKNRKGMSLIIPPFKAPSNQDLIKILNYLDLKPAYKLKLPEFNMNTFNEVPVGFMYFLKLEHIGREKIHGRSVGPTVAKTQQPTAGKQAEGGQRMGELDTYSFISYNALKTLSESFGPLSDDIKSKNEMLSEIVTTGHAEFKEPQMVPVKDLLNFYFTSLILERR